MRKNLALVLVGALAVVGLFLPVGSSNVISGVRFGVELFNDGLKVGRSQQFSVSNDGTVSSTADTYIAKLISGKGKATITTGATTSVSAASVCDYGVISWVPTGANASFTLPTAASLVSDCLPAVGMSKRVFVQNAAATSTFVIASSTGVTSYQASTTGATFVVASSTPTWLLFTTTLASSTDSTVFVGVDKYTITGP